MVLLRLAARATTVWGTRCRSAWAADPLRCRLATWRGPARLPSGREFGPARIRSRDAAEAAERARARRGRYRPARPRGPGAGEPAWRLLGAGRRAGRVQRDPWRRRAAQLRAPAAWSSAASHAQGQGRDGPDDERGRRRARRVGPGAAPDRRQRRLGRGEAVERIGAMPPLRTGAGRAAVPQPRGAGRPAPASRVPVVADESVATGRGRLARELGPATRRR